MAEDKDKGAGKAAAGKSAGGFLGSLREALAAAGRDESGRGGGEAATPATPVAVGPPPLPPLLPPPADHAAVQAGPPPVPPPVPSAQEAARIARGGTPNIPPVDRHPIDRNPADRHMEAGPPPTTRVVKPEPKEEPEVVRTQLIRGRQQVQRGAFHQDPVVGWLVIVGGPGLGSYRPIFEGNNTIGRAATNRIPLEYGDEAISAEEQAYIRYDSADRSFLFVPNMSKTNVVSLNDKKPTAAVALSAMDVIVMGRTQLVFVPFCGTEFDWSELTDTKS